MKSLAIFDPPRALVPGSHLVPGSSSPAGADPTPGNVLGNSAPLPAQNPTQILPTQTMGPNGLTAKDPPMDSRASTSLSSSSANDPHDENGGASTDGQPDDEPSIHDSNDPATSAGAGNTDNRVFDMNISGSNKRSPAYGPSSTDKGFNGEPSVEDPTAQGLPQNFSSDPEVSDGKFRATIPPNIVKLSGGKAITFTPLSTAVVAAGVTLLPHGPLLTIEDTKIRLATSDMLLVGESPFTIESSSSLRLSFEPGITVVPQTNLATADLSVLPGAPAVTILGSRISLASSGLLFVGTDTISLPPLPINRNDFALTVAGQVFTPNPTGFSIATAGTLSGQRNAVVGGEHSDFQANQILHLGGSITLMGGSTGDRTGNAHLTTGRGSLAPFTGDTNAVKVTLSLLISMVMIIWAYMFHW